MTRKEALRQTHQEDTLLALGFTREEAEALRRISMTLRRWHEQECGTGNGCIERDEDTGKAYWFNSLSMRRYPIADRETGARKRLARIIAARNARHLGPSTDWNAAHDTATATGLAYYIQGDPCGAALYIIQPGDVPDGKDVNSYYTRGICVY